MTLQPTRQLAGQPGSPWPCSLVEAALFSLSPGPGWVEFQSVQKLDERICMGLPERDEAHVESVALFLQEGSEVIPEIKNIRPLLLSFWSLISSDDPVTAQHIFDVFSEGFAVIKRFRL